MLTSGSSVTDKITVKGRLDTVSNRIEFFDDIVESIRTFNINTQLSLEKRNKISIIPNTEAKKVEEKQF